MPRSFMIEEHVSMNLKKGRIEGKEIINPVYQKKKILIQSSETKFNLII